MIILAASVVDLPETETRPTAPKSSGEEKDRACASTPYLHPADVTADSPDSHVLSLLLFRDSGQKWYCTLVFFIKCIYFSCSF